VLYAQLYNFVELVKGEDKEYKKESLFEFKEPIENEKKEIVRDEYMTVEEYADHFGVSAQTALMRNKEGYIVDVLFEDGKFFFKRSTNSTDELFQKNKLDKLHSNGYITAREFSSIADVDIQTVTDRCAKGMVEGAYMDACKEWIVPAGSDPTAVQDADLPELASRIGIAIQNAHKQAKKGKIPGMYEIGRDLKYKKLLFKRDLFEQYVADYLATKNNSKPKVTKEEFKTIRNELVKSREKVRATEISEKDYGEEVEFDPKLPTKLISLNEYARRKGWSFQFAKKRFDDGKLPSAFREGDTIAVRVQAEEDKREVWGHMTLAEYAEKNNVNLATAKYRAKRGQIDGVYKDGNKFFVKIFKPRGEKRILEKWVTLVEYTQLQGICIKEAQIRYHNGKYEGKKVNGKIYFPIYKIVKEDKPEEEGNV
jgi:predicted site-specific integrase-resolvase